MDEDIDPTASALTGPLRAVPLQERLLDVLERAEMAAKRLRCVPDIRSGLPELDRQMIGRRLVAIIGRPLVGKTAMALRISRETSRSGHVLYCSSMGESIELSRRLLSVEADIPVDRITEGRLSREEWARTTEAAVRVGRTPIWLADTLGVAVSQIRAAALRIKDVFGLDLIVVDGIESNSDYVWPALEDVAFRANCSVLAVCETDLNWHTKGTCFSEFSHIPAIHLRDDRESPSLEVAEHQRWLSVSVLRSGESSSEFRACFDKRFALISPP